MGSRETTALPMSSDVPPSASLRGERGAERSCLILPSATLRGEPGTGDGCPLGDRSAPHYIKNMINHHSKFLEGLNGTYI